jgi:tRNA pseudouridine32 synthase / 23S rRNA pseudouridine746 synthase
MRSQLIARPFSSFPKVVFENKFVFIINKPIGIVHHSSPGEDGILKVVRGLQQKGHFSYSGDLFSVHRLDRGTSGLLIFAKTKNAARFFSGVFADRKVTKYYVAISEKRPRKNMGQVVGDIAPNRRSQMKLCRSDVNPSKTRFVSRTLYNCLSENFENIAHSPAPLRLFLVKPLTGQRHQVRVVLKSVGSPVLGDPLYAHHNEILANVDR